MTKRATNRNARTVSFKDKKVQKSLELSTYGITDKAVGRIVGYRPGQVGYRRKLAGVSPLDWRNGNDPQLMQKVRMLENEYNKLGKIVDQMIQRENKINRKSKRKPQ